MDEGHRAKARFSVVYVIVALLALLFVQEYVVRGLGAKEQEVPYSRFRQDPAQGLVEKVTVEPERIVYAVAGAKDGSGEGGERFKAVRIEDEDLVEELVAAGVEFEAHKPSESLLSSLLGWILPILPFVTFADVGGADQEWPVAGMRSEAEAHSEGL